VKDDAQCVHAALAGDSAAFGELVSRYQNRLYNTMIHVIGCEHEAQDVVQDAFVQAFVKLESFQGASAFYTWLYRIAFNAAMSQRRKKKPALSVEELKQQTGNDPIDRCDPPDGPLLETERAAMVRHALNALSEQHRTILMLRELDGQPYEAIAEILDLPVGTVRSRLHRARIELREELKEML
jgi:RNA polymerase sigma-70 factor (ECF subfamily)